MNATPIFHRPELAQKVASLMLSNAIGSPGPSGLFLAAPRRTGKSTFVREDLRPTLQSAGACVIYADLWEDRSRDPGEVIVAAIRAELAAHEGIVAKLARAAGAEKVAVGGLTFSLDRVGLQADVSLSRALAVLSDQIRQPIALIIDEAQHALTTEAGASALFALKAARDELNSSAHHGLRILATGSNRDKLAMLRNSKDQAFFGATLIDMPRLGVDFIQWFCAGVDLGEPLDVDQVDQQFRRASSRPEILTAAAGQVRSDLLATGGAVAVRFAAAVEAQLAAADAETLRVVHALTPLQSSVLRVLAAKGREYAPFEAPTMAAYAAVLQAIAPGGKLQVDVRNVQASLEALLDRGLIWRERRGVYALEEASLRDLLEAQGMLAVVPTDA
jgi:hypothetical protein